MSNQLTLLRSRENHYDNMVRMYSNCSVVLENLEVTYSLEHQDLSFLQVGLNSCLSFWFSQQRRWRVFSVLGFNLHFLPGAGWSSLGGFGTFFFFFDISSPVCFSSQIYFGFLPIILQTVLGFYVHLLPPRRLLVSIHFWETWKLLCTLTCPRNYSTVW